MVLGFRKEWLAELEAELTAYELPRTKVFLEPLDRLGIIEVVEGPTQTERLRQHYGLTIEKAVAEVVADDLLEDVGSSIAPTLQILLTKTWANAKEADYEHPHIDLSLYQLLKRDGILLRDFLNQQVLSIEKRHPRAVQTGLLLDILALHTTPLGTANQCVVDEFEKQYTHQAELLSKLLQCCQDLHLLTVVANSGTRSLRATRLAHDTLAPLVREQFDESDRPGQRARRILDSRLLEWRDGRLGTPLDAVDLHIVEEGAEGTRAWIPDEVRLVEASRAVRERKRRISHIVRAALISAALLIVGLGSIGWLLRAQLQRATGTLEEVRTATATEKKNASLARAEAKRQLGNLQRYRADFAVAQERPAGAAHYYLHAAVAFAEVGDVDESKSSHAAALEHSRMLRVTLPHKAIRGATFSADGTHVLTFGGDGAARVWNVDTGDVQRVFKHTGQRETSGEEPKPYSVGGTWLNDGRGGVLTWSDDCTARLWRLDDPSYQLILRHDEPVRGGRVVKGSSRVITWTTTSAYCWDREKASLRWRREQAATGLEEQPAFSSDESVVATWSGTTITMITLDDEATREFDLETEVTEALFNHDATRLLATGQKGKCRLWNLDTGQVEREFDSPGERALIGATFSSDSSRVLTWQWIGNAYLWDTKTGMQLSELRQVGQQSFVSGARFISSDSQVLTWSSWKGDAMIWDLRTGAPIFLFRHNGGYHTGPVVSKDETILLTHSDRTTKVFRVERDFQEQSKIGNWTTKASAFLDHEKEIQGATISDDLRQILTWSDDGTARVWKNGIQSSRELQRLDHNKPVKGAVFADSHGLVLTWSDDGTARLWKVGEVEPILVSRFQRPVRRATFSADTSQVLVWGVGRAELWDIERKVVLRQFKHDGTRSIGMPGKPFYVKASPCYVKHAMFSRRSRYVLRCGEDGLAKLWKRENGQLLKTFDHGVISSAFDGIVGATFSSDESQLVTWGHNGTARLWDVESGKELRRFTHEGSHKGAVLDDDIPFTIKDVKLSKDNTLLLTRADDGKARLWNMKTGELLHTFERGNAVRGAEFVRDGKFVLNYGDDSKASLWNVQTGSEQLFEHKSYAFQQVLSASLDVAKSRLVTTGADGNARVWDSRSGKLLKTLKHVSPASVLLECRGARLIDQGGNAQLLTWGNDGRAVLWRTDTGERIQAFEHPGTHKGILDRPIPYSVDGTLFNSDKSLLLTWSDDGTARLWKVESASMPLNQRIAEWQRRSASRLDDNGKLHMMTCEELSDLEQAP